MGEEQDTGIKRWSRLIPDEVMGQMCRILADSCD